ncbi:uncharacterized protein N7500_008256 [Penicillium coprophilum]|uniref:uncharacterized protein n=1 Tax=Penicillium coprophilum TaxID=36646 RepID=UPI002399FB9E|nr:uncharacterized protein N7500_008256 [Penicillium coprophilum]KAJ5158605.1 hypothetical protein N7500_008256 [Penicillium coprophilum]
MGNLNLLNQQANIEPPCLDDTQASFNLLCEQSVIDLTSALIVGCQASGKLRRALSYRAFLPRKIGGSPLASFTAPIIRGRSSKLPSLTLSL